MGKAGKSHAGGGLTEKQEQFSRLISAGVSNAEACRIVGINRRTGKRFGGATRYLNTVEHPDLTIEGERIPRN